RAVALFQSLIEIGDARPMIFKTQLKARGKTVIEQAPVHGSFACILMNIAAHLGSGRDDADSFGHPETDLGGHLTNHTPGGSNVAFRLDLYLALVVFGHRAALVLSLLLCGRLAAKSRARSTFRTVLVVPSLTPSS